MAELARDAIIQELWFDTAAPEEVPVIVIEATIVAVVLRDVHDWLFPAPGEAS